MKRPVPISALFCGGVLLLSQAHAAAPPPAEDDAEKIPRATAMPRWCWGRWK